MRVLTLATYDSFLTVNRLIAGHFAAAGAEVTQAVLRTRPGQTGAAQLAALGLDPATMAHHTPASLLAPATLAAHDLWLMALDGATCRRLFLALHRAMTTGGLAQRPATVTVYPGLVLRFAFDGLSARAPADRLWLNSAEDASRHAAMAAALGLAADRARVLGIASLLAPLARPPIVPAQAPVVFFEQTVIPRAPAERAFLARQLVALARRLAPRPLWIKPRVAQGHTTLHRTQAAIGPLLRQAAAETGDGRWPPTLSMVHLPAARLLEQAQLCVTISSTVAVEAIHHGVPTAIIGDFGAHDDLGVPFFYGSGLVRCFDQIDPDHPPVVDAAWRAAVCVDPATTISTLVEDALALAATPQTTPPPVHPVLFSRALHQDLGAAWSDEDLALRSPQRPAGRVTRLLRRAFRRAYGRIAARPRPRPEPHP